jgi:hypothetical protein
MTGRDPDAVWVRGHGMVRGLLVAAILTALAGPASSRPARPAVDPACQGTWKVDPGGPGVDVVILKASSVVVGSNCPQGPIRLRAVKSGTKVTAQLRRCGVRGPVRFAATLQPGCDTLNGSIRFRRGGPKRLDAHRHWCGDGTIDADESEVCDGSDLGDKTCQSFPGFIGGELGCTDKCAFDTSQCTPVPVPHCGDGILDPGEQCDGTVQGGAPANRFSTLAGRSAARRIAVSI